MNIKRLIQKALNANPIVAEAVPDGGLAILYTIQDEVLVLKVDMGGRRLEEICGHIKLHGEPKVIGSKIA